MKTNVLLLGLFFACITAYAQGESSFVQGRNEYLQENYTEALKLFAKAAIEEPQNAEVHYLTAHIYSDMSNYKMAVASFEKAIALDSSRSRWIYECGLIYYAIPDYVKSLQYIQLAAAKGYRKTLDYQENLANAYANVNQYDQAIVVYNQILEKKPSDHDVLYQLAQAYFNSAKYQEALQTWEKLLTLDTTNADALYMTGLCYQKKGETAKGQQICDKAIAWDPSLASKKKTLSGPASL